MTSAPSKNPMSRPVQYQVGQLVWAKIKGYPAWPAKVADPLDKPEFKRARKRNICVQFFGAGDYSFASIEDLRPYFAFKEKLTPSCKKPNFMQSLAEAADYVKNNPGVLALEAEFKTISDDEKYRQWLRENRDDDTASDVSEEVTAAGDFCGPLKSLKTGNGNIIPTTGAIEEPATKRKKIIDEINYSAPPARSTRRRLLSNTTTTIVATSAESENNVAQPEQESLSAVAEETFTALKQEVPMLKKKIGFIGVGQMGSLIVKHLLSAGHDLLLCSRSVKDPKSFESCHFNDLPEELVEECDIVFSCVSDLKDAKALVFDPDVIAKLNSKKAFVQLSSVSLTAMFEFHKTITEKGARYLEVSLNGTLSDAQSGELVLMASGEKSLFDELLSCFSTFSAKAFFLGSVGCATKMHLVQKMLYGTMTAAISEAMAIADRCGMNLGDVAELMEHCGFGSKVFKHITKQISEETFTPPLIKLDTLRKEMQYGLNMASDCLAHPTPMTSTALNMFLFAKNLGHDEKDCSAVFNVYEADQSDNKANGHQ